MSGSLRQVWDYLAEDLWEPLSSYSAKEAEAPPDFYSDLFAAADDFLSPGPTAAEFEEARNDPEYARQRFLALKGDDFNSESALVRFLEEAHDVITGCELAGYAEYYRRLVRDLLRK